MGKRAYCQHCHYPLSVCICDAIQAISCPLAIEILQHPAEQKHAKNSARLLPLCLSNVTITCGESAQDFAALKHRLAERADSVAVFYPSPGSEDFDHNKEVYTGNSPDTLVFIDATWRKAHKMWQLNPWLQKFPVWHFSAAPAGQYHIRSTRLSGAISTLEAVAHVLHQGHDIDPASLYTLFEQMQQRTQHKFATKTAPG